MWRDRELEESFPGLADGRYYITSPHDPTYNCVAWAVGDTNRFWDDVGMKGYYWPPGAGTADTLDGWKKLFSIHGYQESRSSDFDRKFEKIAIFIGFDGCPSHVARQTETGAWTSKLGKSFDIEHWTLEALEGEEYGKIGVIMQRPCKDGRRVAFPK